MCRRKKFLTKFFGKKGVFLQTLCSELYDFYQLIPEDIRKNKTKLVGSGNGIKKNSLICKIFEEQFQNSIHLSQITEEAAFGACYSFFR